MPRGGEARRLSLASDIGGAACGHPSKRLCAIWPHRHPERVEARENSGEQKSPPSPFDRLQRRADATSRLAAALKGVADAGTPLYQSLSDAQQRRFRLLAHILSGNLIVQLGVATEALNRRWYDPTTGQVVTDVQRHVKYPGLGWMAATLDGRVEGTGAVFETKFMRSMRFWPCGGAGANAGLSVLCASAYRWF